MTITRSSLPPCMCIWITTTAWKFWCSRVWGSGVHSMSQKLISTKGVKHGKLTLTTTGQDIV